MLESTEIQVQTPHHTYPIEIGSGNLSQLGDFVTAHTKLTHAVIVTDSHVEVHYADLVTASLQRTGARVDRLVVPAGEPSKSIDRLADLWQRMAGVLADRKSVVIALGGGVVGDLAGFVAATFGRGIPLIQVPTSLLAQVDSSVGGKVGINLPTAKNLVGAFWQPIGVAIDLDVLSTLPDREFRSGLAEVVKYGVIMDAAFFASIQNQAGAILQQQPQVLQQLIAHSCLLKAEVVREDERELTGRRAILNYGHTFAHAIEAVFGYGHFLHGEAVAMGMICASRLAELLGRVDASVTDQQRQLLSEFGLPTEIPQQRFDALLDAMKQDKKTEHGELKFILPSRLGHVEAVTRVDTTLIVEAMKSVSH